MKFKGVVFLPSDVINELNKQQCTNITVKGKIDFPISCMAGAPISAKLEYEANFEVELPGGKKINVAGIVYIPVAPFITLPSNFRVGGPVSPIITVPLLAAQNATTGSNSQKQVGGAHSDIVGPPTQRQVGGAHSDIVGPPSANSSSNNDTKPRPASPIIVGAKIPNGAPICRIPRPQTVSIPFVMSLPKIASSLKRFIESPPAIAQEASQGQQLKSGGIPRSKL